MRVIVNGKDFQVTAMNLDAVLLECGYENPYVATAVNGTFVHKHQRPETELNEGDSLEVVAPMEGG